MAPAVLTVCLVRYRNSNLKVQIITVMQTEANSKHLSYFEVPEVL